LDLLRDSAGAFSKKDNKKQKPTNALREHTTNIYFVSPFQSVFVHVGRQRKRLNPLAPNSGISSAAGQLPKHLLSSKGQGPASPNQAD